MNSDTTIEGHNTLTRKPLIFVQTITRVHVQECPHHRLADISAQHIAIQTRGLL